jgi:hypothetical protein
MHIFANALKLPLFQIIGGCFSFSKYIVFTMYLDIVHRKAIVPEKPK